MMAKSSKTQQDDSIIELAPEQELALASLLSGASDREAAQNAGVSRTTVWAWRRRDDAFKAAMNREQRDRWIAHTQRARVLLDRALDVIQASLDQEDDPGLRLRAALSVVRMSGLGAQGLQPSGAETVRGVQSDLSSVLFGE